MCCASVVNWINNGAFAANPIDHRPDESGLALRYFSVRTSNAPVPLPPVFMSVASTR
jgi:hypothetical protein